jgi:rubrerythrin
MKHLLFRCAEIEETVAKIYRVLADVPAYSDTLQNFWIEMACDEDDHAQQLKLAARISGENVIGEEHIPLAKIESLLREAKSYLTRLQQGAVSAEKALQLTCLLEEKFLQAHINTAATFKDPQTKKMFQSLAEGDRLHVERLQSFMATRNA